MEWVGIIASSIVLLSFIFSSERMIRGLNIVGSVVFIIYGYTIGSFTICGFNTCIIIVNIYQLLRKGQGR